MIKREYQKPTMTMVQLQHHTSILAGSDPKELSGDSDNYRELE